MARPVAPSRLHPPATTKVSVARLVASGVDLDALFAGGSSIRRRVCAVEPRVTIVELESADVALPLSFVPAVGEGQWLRFTRRGAQVHVTVDLSATLDGEARFSDLMQALFATGPLSHVG